MEIITAIALICQLNIGLGDGSDSFASTTSKFRESAELIETKQKSCQNELATCILKKPSRISAVLKCIKERK